MKTIARMALTSMLGLWLATPACAALFSFSTGTPDGLLAALSQPTAPETLETETADDFILSQATFVSGAVIVGLIPPGTPLADISNVEVEVYHVFPADSDAGRTSGPPMFPTAEVPARLNSPADVEIGDATRDGSDGTLSFSADPLSANFSAQKTVVTGIKRKPDQTTRGDGPSTGEEVQITMVFTPPILLPADHYFFRPEVQVVGGQFLYLSAPKPIVPPGTPFMGDLQAWIRNSDLAPDWLRIGTDIIGGTPAPTFNMTFSLVGATIAGTPGHAHCRGQSISGLSEDFGGDLEAAASALGFSNVKALHNAVVAFCEE
jgi:hypothetical protein